jgi:hypothetical protein
MSGMWHGIRISGTVLISKTTQYAVKPCGCSEALWRYPLVTFEDGMLHIMGNLVTDEPAEAGYIANHQEFANYRLRAEYKWGVKRPISIF